MKCIIDINFVSMVFNCSEIWKLYDLNILVHDFKHKLLWHLLITFRYLTPKYLHYCSADISAGKESACSAGDSS